MGHPAICHRVPEKNENKEAIAVELVAAVIVIVVVVVEV